MIPVDQNKKALVSWKRYQTKLPTKREKDNWIAKYNGAIKGWAMPTGVASGIVALDFDGELGIKTLEELGLKPNVKTPSGAYHVWIKSPGFPVKTGVSDSRWPGMELKGDGGYVVISGDDIISHHKGESLVIGSYTTLDETPTLLESLDDSLAEFITGISRPTQQGRNTTGFEFARKLRDAGLSKEEAIEALKESYLPTVDQSGHPYTEEELIKSVESAYSKQSSEKVSVSERIVKAVLSDSNIELWHDNNESYVTFAENESASLFTRKVKNLLANSAYAALGKPASKNAIDEALSTLDAKAQLDGSEYKAHVRIGWDNGVCYFDMGNEIYQIDANGYETIEHSPIKFLRNETLGIMPTPQSSVDGINLLRKYVNVDNDDWPLVIAAVLAPFQPYGAYPIIALTGSHGSGKSTSLSAMTMVTDARPSIDSCRDTLPKDKRTLAISARMNHVLTFDNESYISKEISDALAMLCTGGQFKTRALYTNNEMSIFTYKRPIYINSIGDIVTESDLLDRSIILECPPLETYNNDGDMWAEFERDRPYIIGAIFEFVSTGIRNIMSESVKSRDRLADFIAWANACRVPKFYEAYKSNKLKAPYIAVNNSHIGAFIMKLLANEPNNKQKERNGLGALIVGDSEAASFDWLGSFATLHEIGSSSGEWYRSTMGALNGWKRIKSDLMKIGIEIREYNVRNQTWIALKGNRDEE